MDPQILVVVPVLNEELHLEDVIRSLLDAGLPAQARIVIADGGSSDATVEIANRLSLSDARITVMDNPQRLQSAAVNLAVARFGDGADYLVRIDAHGGYPAGYVKALVEDALATGADSVVVSMDTVGIAGFQRAIAAAQSSILGNGGSAHRRASSDGRWVEHGHHALMRISAFKAVGGYDVTFSHNEDAELDYRLRAAGYSVWLTGKTSMTYYPRTTVGSLSRQYFKYGEGRLKTMFKHRILPQPRQLIMIGVAPTILLAMVTPWLGLAALPFLVWSAFCLAYGAFLTGSAGRPAMTGAAALVMHSSWSFGFWTGLLRNLLTVRAVKQGVA